MKQKNKITLFIFISLIISVFIINSAKHLSGRQNIFKKKCSSCHSLYHPNDYSKIEWREHVKRMSSRAGLTLKQIKSIIKLNKKK